MQTRRRRQVWLAAVVIILIAAAQGQLLDQASAGGRVAKSASKQRSAAQCGAFSTTHPHWTCSFDDEFNATTHDAHSLLASKWLVQQTSNSGYTTGPPGRQACYFNNRHNVWVAHGSLHLRVRQLPRRFQCLSGGGLTWLVRDSGSFTTRYTAGMVSTSHRFAQTYGRFAVRAHVPATTTSGLQETLWLWPVNASKYGGHDASGEIDFAEMYSRNSHISIPRLHYRMEANKDASQSNENVVTAHCPIRRGAFNTYALRWSPGLLTITVNGKKCLVDHYRAAHLAPPAPFDQPFMVVLTQALGIETNAFSPKYTPLPATTRIDWVRVWKRS